MSGQVEEMVKCASSTCIRRAVMAINTRTPRGKGLVHDIYQDHEDAPQRAHRYCGECGVALAANLAALTDSSLQVEVKITRRER